MKNQMIFSMSRDMWPQPVCLQHRRVSSAAVAVRWMERLPRRCRWTELCQLHLSSVQWVFCLRKMTRGPSELSRLRSNDKKHSKREAAGIFSLYTSLIQHVKLFEWKIIIFFSLISICLWADWSGDVPRSYIQLHFLSKYLALYCWSEGSCRTVATVPGKDCHHNPNWNWLRVFL